MVARFVNFSKFLLAMTCMVVVAPLADAEDAVDWIVAVVNGEAILNSQVQRDAQILVSRSRVNGQQLPSSSVLKKIVLDDLIKRSLQRQRAHQLGIQVTSREIDRVFRAVLAQNGLTPGEFAYQRGMTEAQVRQMIGFEITSARAMQADNRSRLDVSKEWSNEVLRSNLLNEEGQEFLIEHASMSEDDIDVAKQLAQSRGDDFAAFANDKSLAFERRWVSIGDLPEKLFAAVADLVPGAVTPILEDGGKLHVIRFVVRRPKVPGELRARSAKLKWLQAPAGSQIEGLEDLRKSIVRGDLTFEEAAKEIGGTISEISMDSDELPVALTSGPRLRVGEISAPFRHSGGFAIAMVLDVEIGEVGAGGVRQQYSASLSNTLEQDLLKEWIASLEAAGVIVILREPS